MEGLFLILCLFLVSVLIILCHQIWNMDSHHQQLPPGKVGWPLVGETWEFLSAGWKGHPETFISDRLSKYRGSGGQEAAVFKTSIIGEKMVVMCGASSNKFVFSNENKVVKSWFPRSVEKIFPSTTQTSYNQESMKLRKFLLNFLKPEALQRYIPIMDAIARQHFDVEWEGKDKVEVLPLAKRYTFSLACRLFLSIDDLTQVKKLEGRFNNIHSGFVAIPINLPGTTFHRAIKAVKLIKEEIRDIIKQRKLDLADGKVFPTQDILSLMLSTTDESDKFMNEIELADKTVGLLIGGHENPGAVCTSIVKYLAELPHIYHAVHQEQIEIAESKAPGEPLNWEDINKMKFSWNVACEVMRLAPPVPGTFREAITEFTYDGFQIPKGWKLHWSVYSTHKDPKYFPEPEKFDPLRFEGNGPTPYTFVPFGGGPRMCPGREYTRLEILVFMHHLVKRFKWDKIIHNEKIVYNPMPMPAKGLPIRLHPHRQT